MKINVSFFSLTLEQQFQMRLVEDSIEKMSREQMGELVIQLSKLVMIKDNALRDLLKNNIISNQK